jgi:CRISPR-associated endonuclease/helicase Cas3
LDATIKQLLTLWGKTSTGKPDDTQYHPLLFHLLDVAHCARLLWRLLPPHLPQRIAHALGVTVDEAEKIVVLLAGIHDLGKASAFQTKATHLWERVKAVGLTIGAPEQERHEFVTAYVLPALLTESSICGWSAPQTMANTLAAITGAHHGKFPPSNGMNAQTLGGPDWTNVRKALAKELANALYPGGATITVPNDAMTDVGVGAILSGFIAVADWLGSNKEFMKRCPSRDIAAYILYSEAFAQELLPKVGWRTLQFAAPKPFSEIIWGQREDGTPIQFAPRRMQSVVAEIAERTTEPYLLIVEAAMGDGKTEAALYAIDRAMTTGQNGGFYVALPTQATGNAMFERVKTFLELRGHEMQANLQLVHGGTAFNDIFQEIAVAPNVTDRQNGDVERPVVAEQWFTAKKQALLAPFGVGTIDQSLMGVLQTKHWFVRLFGLAGKVVVFDEVHAYDVYMGELLESLIRWLSELGCSVILLSATLPAARREALITAYRAGKKVEVLETAAYPRVTFVPKSGAAESVNVAEENGRTINVTLQRAAVDYTALSEKIVTDLPNGGCAAVICNTVRQAQAAYDAIFSRLAPEWDVTLFHARTPLAWRKEKEASVLQKFGKPNREGVVRPKKAVLIGTQVLEQSLDYDVDWMASEMAPIDLLLQRMGRLWRHDRPERPVKTPRFVVLLNQIGDTLPSFPLGTAGEHGVYDEYVLLRSVLALRDRTSVTLPNDIEPLITAVYDTTVDSPNDIWQEQISKTLQEQKTQRRKDQRIAENNCIIDPIGEDSDFLDHLPNQEKDLIDDDDPTTHGDVRATTRLGDPSLVLLCLRQDEGGRLTPFCGGGPVFLDKRPSAERVKEMLLSALSLSRPKELFFTLLKEPAIEAWKEEAHLRFARHAIFDATGRATIGNYTVTLDKKKGLLVVKEPPE